MSKSKASSQVSVTPNSASFTQTREAVWLMRLHQAAAALEQRDFAVSTVQTLGEAKDLVMNHIFPETQAKFVSFGGSMTLMEAGIIDAFKQIDGITVADTTDFSIGMDALLELRRQALLCDLLLCSANALTEDGVLMLLDGTGNRTAAVQFGPKKIVMIIGRNKLCVNMDDGFERVQKLAAPANALRLHKQTPCTKTGYCVDCSSPDRICSTWAIMTRCRPKHRIHVVLVNQEVGY